MRTATRIADLIRALKTERGLSYKALGRIVGQSSTYLSDVANGRRLVHPATAGRYAKALGADVDAWITAAIKDKLDRE